MARKFADAVGVTVLLPPKLLADIEHAAEEDFSTRTDMLRQLLQLGLTQHNDIKSRLDAGESPASIVRGVVRARLDPGERRSTARA